VSVADLVGLAGGVADGARFLTALGADGAAGDPQRVERSVPLATGLERGLLALRLNGEPLPSEHGGPLRLVIPGFFAVNSVKWLVRLSLTAEESDADIQTVRYRLTLPGSVPGPEDPSCWEMPVKSWVTSPEPGADVSGPIEVEGVAFSGAGPITDIEVTVDGGITWLPAVLGPSNGPASWHTFSLAVDLGGSRGPIASRARDSAGNEQPANSIPDINGYAPNGWLDHAVPIARG
jgi:sulfite dehydrogenase